MDVHVLEDASIEFLRKCAQHLAESSPARACVCVSATHIVCATAASLAKRVEAHKVWYFHLASYVAEEFIPSPSLSFP